MKMEPCFDTTCRHHTAQCRTSSFGLSGREFSAAPVVSARSDAYGYWRKDEAL